MLRPWRPGDTSQPWTPWVPTLCSRSQPVITEEVSCTHHFLLNPLKALVCGLSERPARAVTPSLSEDLLQGSRMAGSVSLSGVWWLHETFGNLAACPSSITFNHPLEFQASGVTSSRKRRSPPPPPSGLMTLDTSTAPSPH